MRNAIDFEKLFPIYKVEQDALLSYRGEVTLGFQADLPEIFTLPLQQYEAFHHAWVKALRLLPAHTVFHKQDWFLEEGFRPTPGLGDLSFLSQSSDRFFQGRTRLRHRCFLFFTRRLPESREVDSLLSSLLWRPIVPRPLVEPGPWLDFQDRVGQFARVLEDSGFVRLHRLQDSDFVGSRSRPGLLEQYCLLLNPQEPCVLQDIHLQGELRVGDRTCRTFTLADAEDLPPLCGPRLDYARYSTDRTRFSVGFATPLGALLPCSHVLNQYIFLGDPAATLKRLEARRLRLQSLSSYSRGNALARDATHAFLHEAISEQRLPVKAHVNVLAWTEDPLRIGELKNLVSTAMTQLDATPKLETDGAPQLFWAGLPGNEGDFPMNETFDTFVEQASCLLNLETGYHSDPGPQGVRLGDRLTGFPVLVDLSDGPMRRGVITNRNKFILGPSGSGKSFFTNHMVRSYHEQGAHVVLVDVGHSYRGLCELLNGRYLTYEAEEPLAFNPFLLGDGEILDTEKRESLKTLLLALWKKEDEPFRRSEYVALSHALQGFYDSLGDGHTVVPCFNAFYDYLSGDYTRVLREEGVQEKDFDLSNLLYVLRPFYRGGEFDFLLNAPQGLNLLRERFIVFELDNIKDHPVLLPVVTIILMEVFISKMRRLKGVRKMILIEEAWKAIARDGMAEYIRYLFKTVRKFYGEAVVVTQEVEDILSSPIVKQAILGNSDCKILLDQSKYLNRFGLIQELLGLTEQEKTQVLSLNRANDPARRYKEVFISLGGQESKVYRTEVSPEEYLAYTTEETERLEVQRWAAHHGSLEKGITALAAQRSGQSSMTI